MFLRVRFEYVHHYGVSRYAVIADGRACPGAGWGERGALAP